jgi:predicted nuclease of predicted toxin-antitoxin system
MKILFDQNISFRIVRKLKENWPEIKQVRELGFENKRDKEIWDFAKLEGYAILTFDSDFFDLANLHGSPPKIIWLRFGNKSTNELAEILQLKSSIIEDFVKEQSSLEFSCLQLDC